MFAVAEREYWIGEIIEAGRLVNHTLTPRDVAGKDADELDDGIFRMVSRRLASKEWLLKPSSAADAVVSAALDGFPPRGGAYRDALELVLLHVYRIHGAEEVGIYAARAEARRAAFCRPPSCPHCDRTGLLSDLEPCGACDGTGVLDGDFSGFEILDDMTWR